MNACLDPGYGTEKCRSQLSICCRLWRRYWNTGSWASISFKAVCAPITNGGTSGADGPAAWDTIDGRLNPMTCERPPFGPFFVATLISNHPIVNDGGRISSMPKE